MIAFTWTLAWAVAPFAGFLYGVACFARWVERRTDCDGFAEEFVPLAADVAVIEARLPRMVVRR